jgi:hypothetical protein
MSKLLRVALKGLTVATAIVAGTSAAQARNGWNVIELVYQTADAGLIAGLSASDLFYDIGLAATEQPDFSITPVAAKRRSGWRGIVDVEIEREPTLDYETQSVSSDLFAKSSQARQMRGVYTMRYDFDTGLDLVPYAGAGLGVVAKGTEAEMGGTVAGRATAGFDLMLAAETAVFAEYAFTKSGGVAFGESQAFGVSSEPLAPCKGRRAATLFAV